jgi:transcriptional regulator with XRE-family HTH domain
MCSQSSRTVTFRRRVRFLSVVEDEVISSLVLWSMKHSTFNYVRAHRKRHALTEEELAFLLNQRSRTAISLIETGDRVPTLAGALALQVVFGLPPKEVFPELYEHVEEAVMRRGEVLYEKLDGKSDARSQAKLSLLEEMAGREEDKPMKA